MDVVPHVGGIFSVVPFVWFCHLSVDVRIYLILTGRTKRVYTVTQQEWESVINFYRSIQILLLSVLPGSQKSGYFLK
jgi:hypothetical protein